jgi:hypothetical protein
MRDVTIFQRQPESNEEENLLLLVIPHVDNAGVFAIFRVFGTQVGRNRRKGGLRQILVVPVVDEIVS